MNTPTLSYIYNRKSAERIFEKDVKRVDIYTNAILVVFEKGQGSPRFVSKAVFKKHFAEYRKSSSRQVFVSYQPLYGYFRAPSSHNIQEAYRIELYPDHLECSCKDWEVQEQLGIAKPTCKHCYAVLDYIGFDTPPPKGGGFSFHRENLESTELNPDTFPGLFTLNEPYSGLPVPTCSKYITKSLKPERR